MLKVGICEDNKILQDKYYQMCVDFFSAHQIDVDIVLFDDGAMVVEYYKKKKMKLDILLLDVLLPHINGIDVAKIIRKSDTKGLIIFLTSSEEYIFESMDVQSFSYLLKEQMTQNVLEKVLLEAVDTIEENRAAFLDFEKNNERYHIPFQDISFVKIYSGYCYIHHWDGIIFESDDLSIVNTLLENHFFKVHEQYVINLQFIGKIESDEIEVSDKRQHRIPMEQQYVSQLKQSFARYMIEKL